MWKVVLVVIAGIVIVAALQDPNGLTAESGDTDSATSSASNSRSQTKEASLPVSFISTRDDISEVTDAARRCVAALQSGGGGIACDSFDAAYASTAEGIATDYDERKAEWGEDVPPSEVRALDTGFRTMQRRVSEIDGLRNPWIIWQGTSQIDDSPSVTLSAESNERIGNRLGRNAAPATLTLSCRENTTRLLINMNGNHMASSPYHDWGHVTMRIDSRQAFTRQMQESTDNSVLGLWRGGQSIPVIRDMFGAEKLTVRATPFGQSPITVTFDINGLQEEIQPLRQACNW